MRVVILDAPEDLIAERHRLGHDRFDEVWEGEYHMVPFPTGEHQRVGYRLGLVLAPLAEEAGLQVRPQFGLTTPRCPTTRATGAPTWCSSVPSTLPSVVWKAAPSW